MSIRHSYKVTIYLGNDVWVLPSHLVKRDAEREAKLFKDRGFEYRLVKMTYSTSSKERCLKWTVNDRCG